MKVYVLALEDKKSGLISSIAMNYDLMAGCSFIIKNLVEIYKDLPDEGKSLLNDYQIVKLADLDIKSKEFTNDYNVLVSLKNYNFNGGDTDAI